LLVEDPIYQEVCKRKVPELWVVIRTSWTKRRVRVRRW
jgi:hypothetical protein